MESIIKLDHMNEFFYHHWFFHRPLLIPILESRKKWIFLPRTDGHYIFKRLLVQREKYRVYYTTSILINPIYTNTTILSQW